MKVKDLMVRDVLTCAKDDPVLAAAKKMLDHNVGMLVVVEDHLSRKPMGVVSDRDLLDRALVKKIKVDSTAVEKVMSKRLISVGPQESMEKAVELMKKNGIKRLVVIDDLGALVGILSKEDVIRQILDIRRQLLDMPSF